MKKMLLELPMNCFMGRTRKYHTIYVICWIRIWALLEKHKEEIHDKL